MKTRMCVQFMYLRDEAYAIIKTKIIVIKK